MEWLSNFYFYFYVLSNILFGWRWCKCSCYNDLHISSGHGTLFGNITADVEIFSQVTRPSPQPLHLSSGGHVFFLWYLNHFAFGQKQTLHYLGAVLHLCKYFKLKIKIFKVIAQHCFEGRHPKKKRQFMPHAYYYCYQH